MNRKEIRHNRIIQLRNMAFQGAGREQLFLKCKSWKMSKPTAASYIEEVVESIEKMMAKNV